MAKAWIQDDLPADNEMIMNRPNLEEDYIFDRIKGDCIHHETKNSYDADLEAYVDYLESKAENLPVSDVSFSLDDLKSFFNKGWKAGHAEALSKPQDILPSYDQHIDYEVGRIIHRKKSNES